MTARSIALATGAAALIACQTVSPPEPSVARVNRATYEFETDALGTVPLGFVPTTTNALLAAGTWEVMQGPDVPSRTHVVGLVDPNHIRRDAYNLLWTDHVAFLDGEVRVDVLPRSGSIDQGGGPIWRVQDENNYYICRWNPLEQNFRLYVVHDGERRQLASAPASYPAGEWHRIVVDHDGDQITCTLGGDITITATDGTIRRPGGAGLWTKADALSAFDGLIVTPEGE